MRGKGRINKVGVVQVTLGYDGGAFGVARRSRSVSVSLPRSAVRLPKEIPGTSMIICSVLAHYLSYNMLLLSLLLCLFCLQICVYFFFLYDFKVHIIHTKTANVVPRPSSTSVFASIQ